MSEVLKSMDAHVYGRAQSRANQIIYNFCNGLSNDLLRYITVAQFAESLKGYDTAHTMQKMFGFDMFHQKLIGYMMPILIKEEAKNFLKEIIERNNK